MSSWVSVTFEGAVALVLIVAAWLSWRVDRRLAQLRSGQDGVAKAVGELATAVARAQASVAQLKAVGAEAGAELEDKVREARALSEELSRLSVQETPRPVRDRGPIDFDVIGRRDRRRAGV